MGMNNAPLGKTFNRDGVVRELAGNKRFNQDAYTKQDCTMDLSKIFHS